MSNPNRRGAMALVSASLCLTLAALFYFTAPAPALTASAPIAVPAAADWGLSFPTEGESPIRRLLPGGYQPKGPLPHL